MKKSIKTNFRLKKITFILSFFLLVCLGISSNNTARAQDNTGKEFWFTIFAEQYVNHFPGIYLVGYYDCQVTIDYVARNPASDPSGDSQCTKYTINLIGGVPQFVSIPYNSPPLCTRFFDNYATPETVQKNGIRVTSTAPIALYSKFIMDPANPSSELTPILPIEHMGTEYIVSAYREITYPNENFQARVSIVGIEDGSNITISLPNNTWTSKGIAGTPNTGGLNAGLSHLPGTSWSISLNKGETYTILSWDNDTEDDVTTPAKVNTALNNVPPGSSVSVNNNQGLNGVKIISDKKISVLGGTDCTWIGYDEYPGCGACDLTTTHFKGTNNWGKRYVTTQTLVRPNQMSVAVDITAPPVPNIEPYPATAPKTYNDMSVSDYLLISAKDNATSISITGRTNYSKTLNAGEWFIYESPGVSNPFSPPPTSNPGATNHVISSNNPIQVVQMMKGWQCDNNNPADPTQMLVLEESSWRDNYIVTNPSDYANNFFAFIVKEPAGTAVARSSLQLNVNGTNIPIPAGNSPTGDGTAGWTKIGNEPYYFQRLNTGLSASGSLRAKSIPTAPGGATYPFAFYASGSTNASSYGFMGGAVCKLKTFASATVKPFNLCSVPNTVTVKLDSTQFGGSVLGMKTYNYTFNIYDTDETTLLFTFTGSGATPSYTFTPPKVGILKGVLILTDNAGCPATCKFDIEVVRISTNVNDLPDVVACGSYTLPAITGTNMSGSQAYYTATGGPTGAGTKVNAGTVITSTTTLYIYDRNAPLSTCFDEENVTITISTNPKANFSYPASPYCNNAANPNPTMAAGATKGTFSSTAGLDFVSPTTGQINLTTSTPGTYTTTNTIPAANGCVQVVATASVTITALPTGGFSYVGSPYCKDAANPSPTMTGTTKGSFSATPAGLSINAGSGLVNLTASSVGPYSVTNTIAAANGCPAVAPSATISINAVKSSAFNYDAGTFCQAEPDPTPTITGTAGGTFTATPAGLSINASTGTINLTGSGLGQFTVRYTTANPCGSFTNVMISIINGTPDATFTYSPDAYCQNEVDPSPNYTTGSPGVFTATPAGLSISSSTGIVDLSASSPGLYDVTNTVDAGGCGADANNQNITINAADDASFSYSAPSYCVTASDPTPTAVTTGSYTGTPGLIIDGVTGSIDLDASTVTTHTVTFTTTGSCPSVFSADVTIDPAPTANFSYPGTPYCKNAANPTALVVVGSNSGTFTCSNIDLVISNSVSGLIDLAASTAGVYTVTNTVNSSDCAPATYTSTITITAMDNSAFTYAFNSYCKNTTYPTPTAVSPGGTYSTTTGVVFVSAGTGQINLASTPVGTHNIVYTTSGVCPTNTQTTITITAAPDATFSFAGPYCKSGSNPSPTMGTGAQKGQFTVSPIGLNIDPNTGVVNLGTSTAGSYTVTNTIAAVSGCDAEVKTAPITITVVPNATISYAGPYCQYDANPSPTLGAGASSGTYSGTSGLILDQTTGVVDLASSTVGNHTVTNTIAASGGCPKEVSTTPIVINETPTITASNNGPVCVGGTLNLTSTTSTPGTFSWTGPGSYSVQNPEIMNASKAQGGTYSVVVTVNGCNSIPATTVAVVNDNPVVSFTTDKISGCIPLTVTFINTSTPLSSNVTWDFGDGTISNSTATTVTHVFNTTNCFDLTLTTTSNNCSSTLNREKYICTSSEAVAGLSANKLVSTTLNTEFIFTNNSTNADSLMWVFGDGDTLVTGIIPSIKHTYDPEVGTYLVEVYALNKGGCPDRTEITIIIDEELIFYIPNTFTPDDNNLNQLFKPVFSSGYDPNTYLLRIFDRWGEIVFESNSIENGWDGTKGSMKLPSGTYTWTLQFADQKTAKKHKYQGHINLLK
jgi:gliding motility-associated-like protein